MNDIEFYGVLFGKISDFALKEEEFGFESESDGSCLTISGFFEFELYKIELFKFSTEAKIENFEALTTKPMSEWKIGGGGGKLPPRSRRYWILLGILHSLRRQET
ncbi:Uncharacterized protein Fot_30034 [Forsythia ovata]|uniref:Uncharacterized protein n=1 Tax=Forsythia ovata TaxID=205694 RepID=A0ABD1TU52_9LAMI